MKPPIIFAFVFIAADSSGQAALIDKVVIEASANYKPANVELFYGDQSITAFQFLGGKMTFKNDLETGYYHVIIKARGQLQTRSDSIFVQKGQSLQLTINLVGPCLYDHPVDQAPICPEQHTDKIIPIVYGLVGQTKTSSDVQLRLGGCSVTDCDPKYYCTLHKIEF